VKEREKEKREGEKERKGLAGGKKGTTSRGTNVILFPSSRPTMTCPPERDPIV
jgi:hypothetical protein